MLRAKLFSSEGFGIWNNWWYGGHHTPGYSVLFPAVSSVLTPQLAAGLATTGTAAAFEALVHDRYGKQAWLAALWFGAATALDLFTGRLAFAFGLLWAVAAVLALERRRPAIASLMAVITALCSPVAALFVAVAGAAHAASAFIEHRRLSALLPGTALVAAALLPVLVLVVAFPEGGVEPFVFSAFWPVPVICVVALLALPRRELTLRVGIALYLLGCTASYAIPSAVGGNAVRLATLFGGPLAALIWWRRHPRWLLAAAVPLLYLQWQPSPRDVVRAAGDPSSVPGYYKPLLSFLARQSGPPFRIEIPFTGFHWEAFEVASRFPIARGWERQLDYKDNHLFYDGTLTPAAYRTWLGELAVRFVAVSDGGIDYSARRERELIDRGLPYLHEVMRSRHWRVFAVVNATPIVQGPATLQSLGPDSLQIRVRRAGSVMVHVRYTPYWRLSEGSGCVLRAGQFTALRLRSSGEVRLQARFSPSRIRADSPSCR
jgi:hypothetical protein